MPLKSLLGSEDLARYVNRTMVQEPELHRRLRAETEPLPSSGMQISADQGAFLAFLVRVIGARRALEIGTFTGYSALCIASALPADGELVACDISERLDRHRARYWHEAGIAGRITLHLAPTQQTLAALIAEGRGGSFDFAFIDADKEFLRRLLRGGARVAAAGRRDGAGQHDAARDLGRGCARPDGTRGPSAQSQDPRQFEGACQPRHDRRRHDAGLQALARFQVAPGQPA